MKTTILACTLLAAAATRLPAQRYDYQQLLDSTATAANAVLIANGHRATGSNRRADGFTEQNYAIGLPDSAGTPGTAMMRLVVVSRRDTISRIGIHVASSDGPDSTLIKTAADYFIRRMRATLGREAAGGEGDYCWSTRRNFVTVTLDRAYGEVTLTVGFSPPDR